MAKFVEFYSTLEWMVKPILEKFYVLFHAIYNKEKVSKVKHLNDNYKRPKHLIRMRL